MTQWPIRPRGLSYLTSDLCHLTSDLWNTHG